MEKLVILLIALSVILIGFTLFIFVKYANTTKGKKSFMEIGTITRGQLTTSERSSFDKFAVKADVDLSISLPDEFSQNPEYMSSVVDQEQCGSCWAFATVSTMSDRIRKQTNGEFLKVPIDYIDRFGNKHNIKNQLSPHLLASCDYCKDTSQIAGILKRHDKCNEECNGGVIEYAYIFLNDNGMITIACNQTKGKYSCHTFKELGKVNSLTGKTNIQCVHWKFGKPTKVNIFDTYALAEEKNLKMNEKAIMAEIYKNGTVTASYTVYTNFYKFFDNDKKAVYDTVGDTDADGGHAICIVGWGVDAKTQKPFWLCRNSWSSSWGDEGYFRIIRGKNFCGIEEDVWCTEMLNKFKPGTTEANWVEEDDISE